MSALQALKRVATAVPKGARSFQSSSARLGGHADEPAYIHAKHMYNITEMQNRGAKFGAAIVGVVGLGFGIPFFAVKFTQAKTRG